MVCSAIAEAPIDSRTPSRFFSPRLGRSHSVLPLHFGCINLGLSRYRTGQGEHKSELDLICHTNDVSMSYMSKKMFSVRLDERLVRDIGRSAGTRSASETIQRALELLGEEQRERRFWRKWAGKGGRDAFRSIDKHDRRQ